MIGSGLNDLE